MGLQLRQLARGFDSHRGDLHAEVVRQSDDRVAHRSVLRSAVEVPHHRAIDSEDVDGNLVEASQHGASAAASVHCHANTQRAKPVGDLLDRDRTLDEDRFGDVEAERGGFECLLAKEIGDQIDEAGMAQLLLPDIHGHLQCREGGVLPAPSAELPYRAGQNVRADRHDQSDFVSEGHEFLAAKRPAIGDLTPRDRFAPDQASVAEPDDGLICGDDALVLQRVAELRVDLGLIGDLRRVLETLAEGLEPRDHRPWIDRIRSWQDDANARCLVKNGAGPGLLAAQVIHELWLATGGDVTNVTDVGQHQMWEAQYFPHRRPHTLITSAAWAPWASASPPPSAPRWGGREEEVWAIVGDGGFQMTMAELSTAVNERVEIKIAIINNGFLGMVRQWQEFFYERRYHATPLANPDFCKLCEAFGVPAVRVDRHDQIEAAVARARGHRGGPFLIEFVVVQEDAVFPMVPAGAALDDMIRRPIEETAVTT